MNNKNSVFTAKDDKGKTTEFEVLFTFDSKLNDKSYVVYTDHTKIDGLEQVYANVYDKSGKDKTLYPIETETEWNTIETILSKLEENSNEK